MELDNNEFRVSMLASGSSGNCTYIETPKRKILVDCGLSGKKIQQLMHGINRDISEVDTILVTHEHRDHVHGLGVLARKYGVDIYANEATWKAMPDSVGKIKMEQKHIFEMGEVLTLGDIDIQSFGVSHDAAAPQFYSFHYEKRQFAMLTDTGYVSERLRALLRNANAYLIESNHDLELLRMGRYPWSLKQRILGDEGHLSNDDGALAVAEMVGNNTKRIYLGHLSQDNNMKQLAHETAERVLISKNLGVNEDFYVYDTDPSEATELFTV
ncbi:MBL fold metallo-hydrolase [Jeotgalibaca ciconiae]|uniref:MBL fold metallo-hydrolase n=1 Tax=Jeotgalibaca ciconiae TaxID=2496265 RepID=A0A3S9HE90_9LACT|nr:MBL fold metallo-hydrolase [Jeotgalibaca ciconiae]AZP05692.1 MBL fold metallo-hydrolase [Jeotgalibaca ciconiae]HJB24281.1 MBL fold metallo-hydrolase [Candidatus Jeotgalibaca pullicola]